MSLPFCVPEKPRPFYFAGSGKYRDSDQPITVQDFSLWAQISSLDTITSPATVIVTKSRGASAFMYRVDFESDPPDLFEIVEQSGMKIFSIPSDRFIQLEAIHPCVPVPQNNWEECSLRFHTLAAFYRLNIIPSLSLSLFEREDLFDSVCEIFYDKYRVVPPLNNALAEIFDNVLFALEFFGFAIPSNLAEKTSIEASKKLIELNLTNDDENFRPFAFSEIKFAIENYHKECFPNRQSETGIPPDVFDYTSYSNLLHTVEFVRRSLSMMNILSDDVSTREALFAGVNQFQLKNGQPTGSCDLFTIRHIWNASLSNECDLLALCRLSGMEVKEHKTPICTKTLSRIDVTHIDPDLRPVESVVNEILESVKDRSEAPQWLMNEAQKSVEDQMKRIDKAAKTAKEIDKVVSEIEAKLDSTCQQNEESVIKFNETTKLLDQILDEHLTMRKEFSIVKRRIDETRNGNTMLLIIIIIMAFFVIYHFLQG